MFDADRPITIAAQDRLGRATFAKYLARCLLDHQEPESLVVGLYGGWGVGKTSLINLIVEELDFAATNLEDEVKPIILNFSAWSYSGQDQLIYSFFRRLSATIRNVSNLKSKERIIQLLELYVSFFTHKPIPKPFRVKKKWHQYFSYRHAENIFGWESGRDLTQVKAELNELLKNQPHKIIILIDNISRLYPKEIKQIFQIVKSMGDYQNTVYLLALDKHHVVQALSHDNVTDGKEYLDKVVQLPFEVPPISHQDMENIFIARMGSIIEAVPQGAWNREAWADVYSSALKFLFDNVRDITRYTNTLGFGYSRSREVVDPVDYFALTALEVFAPEVYQGVRENKDLFTSLLDQVYQNGAKTIAEDKLRCDEIMARNKTMNQPLLLNIMMYLFPRVRSIYFPDRLFYQSINTERKLKRISAPDLFDAYFRLGMQSGYIPHSEFNTLLALANNKDMFDEAVTRLNQDNRILYFLNLLDNPSVIASIEEKQVPIIVGALLNNGDLFANDQYNLLSISTPSRIHRIVRALLARLGNSAKRAAVLQTAIEQANKSLLTMVYELVEQAHEHDESSENYVTPEHQELTQQDLNDLEKSIVAKIHEWADNGSLIEHPKLFTILCAWAAWDNDNAVKQFVLQATKIDKGLIAFLSSALEAPIISAMTQYNKQTEWEHYLDDINALIDCKLLEEHAKALFEDEYFDKLREKEQLSLMIFLDLMHTPTKKIIRQATPD